MTQELKHAIKLINERCKETTYKEYRETLQSKKLDKLIYHLKGEFVSLVDWITINYSKTQMYKKRDNNDLEFHDLFSDDFEKTELTKGERERAIEVLQWFKQDIEQCIGHLQDNK